MRGEAISLLLHCNWELPLDYSEALAQDIILQGTLPGSLYKKKKKPQGESQGRDVGKQQKWINMFSIEDEN